MMVGIVYIFTQRWAGWSLSWPFATIRLPCWFRALKLKSHRRRFDSGFVHFQSRGSLRDFLSRSRDVAVCFGIGWPSRFNGLDKYYFPGMHHNNFQHNCQCIYMDLSTSFAVPDSGGRILMLCRILQFNSIVEEKELSISGSLNKRTILLFLKFIGFKL